MLSLSAQTTWNVVIVVKCQICFDKEVDDLDNDGGEEGEPDDVEDEEEGHEEVEDVVDREHLNQLQRKLFLTLFVSDIDVIRNVQHYRLQTNIKNR